MAHHPAPHPPAYGAAAAAASPPGSLHDALVDALARGLLTPAEIAGIGADELAALEALMAQAQTLGDAGLVRTLAAGLLVLNPFAAAGWAALSWAQMRAGRSEASALALAAARLLSPAQAASSPEDTASPPPEAGARPPLGAAAQGGADGSVQPEGPQALELHDGRPLPLQLGAVAALHDGHEGARARADALRPEAHAATVQWATRTWDAPMGDLEGQTAGASQGAGPEAAGPRTTTQTAIVDRPGRGRRARRAPEAGAAPEPAPEPAKIPPGDSPRAPHTQTAVRARFAPQTAAARRHSGWPMTDEITLTHLHARR